MSETTSIGFFIGLAVGTGCLIAALLLGIVLGWHTTLWAYPRLALSQVMAQFSVLEGENEMVHFLAPDSVAMPLPALSPDFLYSACVYNIGDGAVEIRIPVPKTGYWSAAFYASGEGHFHTINHTHLARGRSLWVELNYAGSERASNAPFVEVPSRRGLVLFRFPHEDERAPNGKADQLRREGVCRPLQNDDNSR